jgi:hypothetical protein
MFCATMIMSCQQNRKGNTNVVKYEQNSNEKLFFECDSDNETSNQKNESSWDLINKVLYSSYTIPDSIGNHLPKNAKDYFLNVNLPYRFPEDLHIDYFCKKENFQIEDFFIFKTKNNHSTCEYIAIIDTVPFIEIIARQCVDMENWIGLYILSEDYKIIDFEFLMIASGSDLPELKFDNQSIQFLEGTDTLIYSSREYRIFTDEEFLITDDSGKSTKNIGLRRLKLFTINEKGEIIRRDSIIHKREYYDMYWARVFGRE